jgi:hypothetical protein
MQRDGVSGWLRVYWPDAALRAVLPEGFRQLQAGSLRSPELLRRYWNTSVIAELIASAACCSCSSVMQYGGIRTTVSRIGRVKRPCFRAASQTAFPVRSQRRAGCSSIPAMKPHWRVSLHRLQLAKVTQVRLHAADFAL